jgi:hypothetical protein
MEEFDQARVFEWESRRNANGLPSRQIEPEYQAFPSKHSSFQKINRKKEA